jgi:hypothetical protein
MMTVILIVCACSFKLSVMLINLILMFAVYANSAFLTTVKYKEHYCVLLLEL